MEDAIKVITTINSKAAKEKYLKDNFDKVFIAKLEQKVPMLLENESKMKRSIYADDNLLENDA